MKLLIIGCARHGKDTVADMVKFRTGLPSTSTSFVALSHIIFPALQPIYKYLNLKQCFEDRINHRKEWYDLIEAYNFQDPTRLARVLLQDHDICVGMRGRSEVEACLKEKLFDVVVWVDATKRHPIEHESSCTVDESMADLILNNNGNLKDLEIEVDA